MRNPLQNGFHCSLEYDGIPNGNLLNWNSPLCVLITTTFCDTSANGIFDRHGQGPSWKIASRQLVTKMSSIFGSGYVSNFVTRFRVTLKSPHILMNLSLFTTGTIGVAHWESSTGVIMPFFYSLPNSCGVWYCPSFTENRGCLWVHM